MKKNELILVVSVQPLPDYRLLVEFNTNEKKIFDFSKYLEWNVFKELKNPELFNMAATNGETVVWNDRLDIAPERLYLDGILVD